MKEVKAYIEGNGQGLYSIYTEEDLPIFLIGDGCSIQEAKEDFLKVYEESRQEYLEETSKQLAYTFKFELTVSAFLQQYKGILSLAGLSKLTGINKAQLSQYVCGTRNPSPKTQEKIKEAVRSFANELSQSFA